jgi:hypothetical protein
MPFSFKPLAIGGEQRSVNRGTGGQGIELRKPESGAPTRWMHGEGSIQAFVIARIRGALRSRRPQARQETSCTRTGETSELSAHERGADRLVKAMAVRQA